MLLLMGDDDGGISGAVGGANILLVSHAECPCIHWFCCHFLPLCYVPEVVVRKCIIRTIDRKKVLLCAGADLRLKQYRLLILTSHFIVKCFILY